MVNLGVGRPDPGTTPGTGPGERDALPRIGADRHPLNADVPANAAGTGASPHDLRVWVRAFWGRPVWDNGLVLIMAREMRGQSV